MSDQAEIQGLSVRADMEDASLKKGMKGLSAQLKEVKSEFTLAQAGVKGFSDSLEGMKAKSDNLGKQMNIQSQIVGNLKEALRRAETAYTSTANKQNELREAMAGNKSQYEEAIRLHGEDSEQAKALAEAYKRLEQQYGRNETRLASNNTALANAQTRLNHSQAALRNMEAELEGTNAAIARQESSWQALSDTLGDISNRLTTAGNKLDKFGSTMTKNVSAPIAAIGAATTLATMTYEDAIAKLAAQTGATTEEIESFKNVVQDLYDNNMGEGFDDLATSVAEVNKQTKLTGDSLKSFTNDALILRDTFEYDVLESTRTAKMMMEQFGLSSEQSFDLIAKASQGGLDKNGNLLDSINEYSVHFKQLGFNAEEMFNMFSNGAASGVFDIDKLGDAVKEFGIRAQDGSKTSVEAFSLLNLDANEMQQAFATGGTAAQQAFVKIVKAMDSTSDKVKLNTVGVNLFGTMWEDMGADAVKALTNINGEFDNTSGIMENINSTLYNTTSQEFESLRRDLTEVGVELGETLLPFLKEGIVVLKGWAEGFKDMNDETKRLILSSAGIIALVGPLASGLGGILKLGGSLVGIVSKASAAVVGAGGLLPALKAGLAIATPWTLAIGGIVAGMVLWNKSTEEAREHQKALNETLEEARKIQLDGIAQSDVEDKTKEKNVLEYEIKAYEEAVSKEEEILKKKKALTDELNRLSYDSSSIDEFGGDYSKLNAHIKDLETSIAQLSEQEKTLFNAQEDANEALQDSYGSYDAAKKKLEVYTSALERANQEKELQTKITDSNVAAINDEANVLLDKADKLEILISDYQELSAIESRDEQQSKDLADTKKQLIEILGSEIFTRDEVSNAEKLNVDMCNDEIVALTNLGNANKDLVKLWAEGGLERVKAQKETTLAVLNTIRTEYDAIRQYVPSDIATQVISYQVQSNQATKDMASIEEFIKKVEGVTLDIGVDQGGKGTPGSNSSSSAKSKDPFKEALENFERRRKIGEIAISNEQSELEAIQKKYAGTAENKVEIEEYMYNNWLDIMERKRSLNKLSYDDEIAMYEDGLSKYSYNEYQKAEITSKLLDTKIEHSKAWIEQEKYYGRLSLEEEKKAYERIAEYTKESAEYKKEMAKEIYRVDKELAEQTKELEEQKREAVKKTVDENIKAKEKEYQDAIKKIEDERDAKIEAYQDKMDALQAEYDKEVELEKQKEYDDKIADLEDRMKNVRTQEEFEKLAEELNETQQGKREYTREQQLKSDKQLLQDKIDQAKNEASIAIKLEKEKLDAYKETQNKMLEESTSIETKITDMLKEQLNQRESAFLNSLKVRMEAYQGFSALLTGLNGVTIAKSNLSGSTLASASKTISNVAPSNNYSSSSYNTNNNTTNANMSVTNIIKNPNDIKTLMNEFTTYIQKLNRAKGIQ